MQIEDSKKEDNVLIMKLLIKIDSLQFFGPVKKC